MDAARPNRQRNVVCVSSSNLRKIHAKQNVDLQHTTNYDWTEQLRPEDAAAALLGLLLRAARARVVGLQLGRRLLCLPLGGAARHALETLLLMQLEVVIGRVQAERLSVVRVGHLSNWWMDGVSRYWGAANEGCLGAVLGLGAYY